MARILRCKLVAFGMLALLAALNAQAAEHPRIAEFLKPLRLSGYVSDERPPAFSALTADNGKASLAGLSGRVILLNFWASWCQECTREMPVFERLHLEFARQGLSVVAINARESTAAVREYAKELGLTFPLVLDSDGTINAAYGVIGLPTSFLIGRDGRAVALAVGPRHWDGKAARALIQELLNEPATREEKQ